MKYISKTQCLFKLIGAIKLYPFMYTTKCQRDLIYKTKREHESWDAFINDTNFKTNRVHFELTIPISKMHTGWMESPLEFRIRLRSVRNSKFRISGATRYPDLRHTYSIGAWPLKIDGYPESVTFGPGIDAARVAGWGIDRATSARVGSARPTSGHFGLTWNERAATG